MHTSDCTVTPLTDDLVRIDVTYDTTPDLGYSDVQKKVKLHIQGLLEAARSGCLSAITLLAWSSNLQPATRVVKHIGYWRSSDIYQKLISCDALFSERSFDISGGLVFIGTASIGFEALDKIFDNLIESENYCLLLSREKNKPNLQSFPQIDSNQIILTSNSKCKINEEVWFRWLSENQLVSIHIQVIRDWKTGGFYFTCKKNMLSFLLPEWEIS